MRPLSIAPCFLAICAGLLLGAAPSVRAAEQRVILVQAVEKSEKVSGQGEGVVKAVDTEERRIRIEHGPITGTLQMSGMAMAFRVAPGIDISGFAPGTKVKFTLTRDENRQFVIEKIEAAK
jgi:Cu/Ag efflux protein CusF